MARNVRKKQKHDRKREQRRREISRASSASFYHRAGATGELVAAYINESWKKQGFASMFVLRRTAGHGLLMGAYLVDLWCAGLKDAWGWRDASMEQFRERVLENHPGPSALVRVDLDLIARLVAGGIRFAKQNGFRLPPKYERWTALLGDFGPIAEADLSDFGVGGKLRWVGPISDLKARLIGCPMEEFLARADVEYIFGSEDGPFVKDEDWLEDEEPLDEEDVLDEELASDEEGLPMEGEEILQAATDLLVESWLNAVRRWCFANGVAPHPRLAEVIDHLADALRELEMDALPDVEEDSEEEVTAAADWAAEGLRASLAEMDVVRRAALQGAVDQIDGFMAQFKNAGELAAALGLGDPGEE